jgi:TatD DNase family protein
MMLVDSHCHLDDAKFAADREKVIERALSAGVRTMLAIGSGDGPPDLEAAIRLAELYEPIYASVGVHPHDARKADPETWRRLRELTAHPKVVAVGEIGLDYHYDNSPRESQRAAFIEQLHIARDARLPVIIHTREAWQETLDLLSAHWSASGLGGIVHCFSGGPEEAAQALSMGFYLAFGGVVTFPAAHRVREAAVEAPLDRLLLETDAPYLAPVPRRGQRNEPAFLVYIALRLAELKGIPIEDVTKATTANFQRLCLPGALITG